MISAVTFQSVHSEFNSRAEVSLSVYFLLYQPEIMGFICIKGNSKFKVQPIPVSYITL